MKRLILFDIDGTLLMCGRQVGEIFVSAVQRVFGGYQIPEKFNFAGKTDPMIVAELVRELGFAGEDVLQRLPRTRDLYVEALEQRLEVERMRLLPGVGTLLRSLSARDDVVLGLLTGNWRDGARVKLGRFDLGRFFTFGAFGDDAADRRGLVPVALERARHHGHTFTPEETLIVGDTVLDVDCAQAAGVPCLAVATGFTEAAALRQAGAEWVYEDLTQAAGDFELFQRA